MLKKISNGCVHIVQRYLPDPFIFCILLTIVVFIAAIPAAGATPLQVVGFWGTSIWSLLAFSMQMALVLVLGTAMATAPPVKRLLDKIAGVAKTPFSAIVLVTVVGTVASWLNWGFGLVVGALLAKSIAKKVKGVDYRLLIASAYSGFVVWHAGLSGSIPLTITEVTEAVTAATGGALTESIGMDRTVLSPWNLIACLIILILMPLLMLRCIRQQMKLLQLILSYLLKKKSQLEKLLLQLKNLKIANHYHGSLLSSVLFTLFSISQQQAIL